ncbi:MAG TPA: DUF2795 domain-containing protein [Planctomycetota bacterium]|nr:DUF2795 domain-containing protein [Planctomycetota bacterium]
MNSFFEENKKLCYGLIVAVLLLIVLWPSFSNGRPGVVRFFKTKYLKLENAEAGNAREIDSRYKGTNPRLTAEISRSKQCNGELAAQYDQLVSHVLFIPGMPFRVPYGQSQPGMKFLDIQTKAHTMKLMQEASLRDVEVKDEFFGLNQFGVPPEDKDKRELLLRQAAMIDDLVRKAMDCGVRRIDRVAPRETPLPDPLNKTPFLNLYRVRLEMTASLESIMKFINRLDGFHGTVEPAGVEMHEGTRNTRIKISVGRRHGITGDSPVSFTIFDQVHDSDDGLRYKGRAEVKLSELHDDHCIAIVTASSARYPEAFLKDVQFPAIKDNLIKHAKSRQAPDHVVDLLQQMPDYEFETETKAAEAFNKIELRIAEGDIATTNFYSVMDLKIEAAPADKAGISNKVTAAITVAGVGLLFDEKAQGTAPAAHKPGATGKKTAAPPRLPYGI